MEKLNEATKVCDIVIQNPLTARVFHQRGIDFCCGGDVPLNSVCEKKHISVQEIISEIEKIELDPNEFTPTQDTSASEIIDYILKRFHDIHKSEIPTLTFLMKKVAAVHGNNHPELKDLQICYQELIADLEPHMLKEEQILFPLIKSLEQGSEFSMKPSFHCGSVVGPITQMEREHDSVGTILSNMRNISNQYSLPDGACNSYRGLYAGLEKLEYDLHLHVHLENNVLHPRAKKLESTESIL